MSRLRSESAALFSRAVINRPWAALAAAALLVASFSSGIPQFRTEASGDSLMLQADESLAFYRSIRARYGSDDYLILTYSPSADLFSAESLQTLEALREDVAAIPQIGSVVSILDVPLFESPPAPDDSLTEAGRQLLEPGTDLDSAREELRRSPLYRNRLLSADGRLTALRLELRRDRTYSRLLNERASLRERRLDGGLTAAERRELENVDRRLAARRDQKTAATERAVARVRQLMSDYEADADLQLSGLPMINVDILAFIRHDLRVFGAALVVAMIALLAAVFRDWRWVLLPLTVCAATVASLAGLLGHLGWPVTVVSSNIFALELILILSLNVHLAVRYRELVIRYPERAQHELISDTVLSKFAPAALTAASTMAAFGSLAVSSVKPVRDFGLMMVLGLAIGFLLTFLILPPALVLLGKGRQPSSARITDTITGWLCSMALRAPVAVFAGFVVLLLASVTGIAGLSLDNRFIDYFAESTEIHRGMATIDRRLGGTTPLEIVLDEPDREPSGSADDGLAGLPGEAGFAATSYWYDPDRLASIGRIHRFVADREHVGKVMSLHSSAQVFRSLVGEDRLDSYTLSIIYERVPDSVREALFDPYISADGDQIRLAARVYETDPGLDRDGLLRSIRGFLVDEIGLADDDVHLTGVFVLYNKVLDNLLQSQVSTVAAVFVAILVMFTLVFRSLRVALLAITPNVIGAALVLGVMSFAGIPLDIMTVAIAAVAIGIGVDDTIHFVHRFRVEYAQSGDRELAIDRSRLGVGRAVFYTSVIIVLGFAVLAFSEFVPTVYFGLFTGLAMATALVADLTLLPAMLVRFRAA